MIEKSSHIVIFDGECNLCNASVNFIIKRDPEALFSFTPTQSVFAQSLMRKHQVDHLSDDTFLLIKDGNSFVRSDAALEVARDLTGLWFLFRVFKLIPRVLRDASYNVIARNRYRWFGRRESCLVPTPELKGRFIGL